MFLLPHIDSWSLCQSRKRLKLRTVVEGQGLPDSAEAPARGGIVSAHSTESSTKSLGHQDAQCNYQRKKLKIKVEGSAVG